MTRGAGLKFNAPVPQKKKKKKRWDICCPVFPNRGKQEARQSLGGLMTSFPLGIMSQQEDKGLPDQESTK
jgi:hypothetical protein